MTEMKECLACGGDNLKLCVDLGYQPLANDYDDAVGLKFPLAVNYCDDCWHAQLTHSVDPDILYSHYLYESGTSETLRQWFEDFAKRLGEPAEILDIASNDGTFLRECKKLGWTVQGVDPAANLRPVDIPTLTQFFNEDSDIGQYDVVTAFNVIAHGPNPLSLLKGVKRALKPNGKAYVMVSQGNMWETGQYDTIYHEHHSFFCYESMSMLAHRAGLYINNMSTEPIHGGSLLFTLSDKPNNFRLHTDKPDFEGFAKKVNAIRPIKVVGYGAAAKGVVMINHLNQKLDYVVDESPLKIGKKIPGTNIPIVSPDVLAEDDDDMLIIVYAWNFIEEIAKKVRKLKGDKVNYALWRYYK